MQVEEEAGTCMFQKNRHNRRFGVERVSAQCPAFTTVQYIATYLALAIWFWDGLSIRELGISP